MAEGLDKSYELEDDRARTLGIPLSPMRVESMSLRDWFAGQALLTYSAIYRADLNLSWAETANACYEIADAMLAERAK